MVIFSQKNVSKVICIHFMVNESIYSIQLKVVVAIKQFRLTGHLSLRVNYTFRL